MKKATLTFTCKGCGATATHTTDMVGAFNVGYAREETGFFVVFSQDFGADVWLCPHCFSVAEALARTLVGLLGADSVTLSSILRARPEKE